MSPSQRRRARREAPPPPVAGPSIDEIMRLLDNDEVTVTILPNGEVVTKPADPATKVLTFREDLGGEYAA